MPNTSHVPETGDGSEAVATELARRLPLRMVARPDLFVYGRRP